MLCLLYVRQLRHFQSSKFFAVSEVGGLAVASFCRPHDAENEDFRGLFSLGFFSGHSSLTFISLNFFGYIMLLLYPGNSLVLVSVSPCCSYRFVSLIEHDIQLVICYFQTLAISKITG